MIVTFYHPTALVNAKSIIKDGLRTDQRGKNPFGLDTGVDYAKVYGSEEKAAEMRKPQSIHLIKDYETALEYKQLITASHKVPAVILTVTIDTDKFKMHEDPEENEGVYCEENIPPECIKAGIDADAVKLFKGSKQKREVIDLVEEGGKDDTLDVEVDGKKKFKFDLSKR